MPDSLLPIQGPASQRERDLDALLSGKAGYPTVVLGPLAGALAALRAAPGPDELDGEAAARAAFRLLMLPDAGVAGGVPGTTPLHRGAVAGQRRPDGQGAASGLPWVGETTALPWVAPAGRRPGRRRRPANGRGRWQVMTVAGSAAAAVIVGVAVLAGTFSGHGGQQGPARASATQPMTDASSARATTPVLDEGGASKVPTPRPTPRPSTQQPAGSPYALCQQYMEFVTHPGPPASWPGEFAVMQQLSRMAGGRLPVNVYCAQLGVAGPAFDPVNQGGPRSRVSGNLPGRGRLSAPGMPRLSRAGVVSHFGGH